MDPEVIDMTETQTLSAKETAKVLGIGKDHFYALIADPSFPLRPLRGVRNYRFSKQAIARYLAGEPTERSA